jgi:hypothetical protein
MRRHVAKNNTVDAFLVERTPVCPPPESIIAAFETREGKAFPSRWVLRDRQAECLSLISRERLIAGVDCEGLMTNACHMKARSDRRLGGHVAPSPPQGITAV